MGYEKKDSWGGRLLPVLRRCARNLDPHRIVRAGYVELKQYSADRLFNLILPALPAPRIARLKTLDHPVSRVFIAVHVVNWELDGLVRPIQAIAQGVHFDWGIRYDPTRGDWESNQKGAFNCELLEAVRKAHREQRIDVFFSYLSGEWLLPGTIEQIRRWGIYCVNFGFDDTHAFLGFRTRMGWTGVAGVCRDFDLNITAQRRLDSRKFKFFKAPALFLPPGGNPDAWRPVPGVERTSIDLLFIGQRYGRRARFIEKLQKTGVPMRVFGSGWPAGPLPFDALLREYSSTVIALGIGFTGRTGILGMKGRDLEIPLTGAAYITTYLPELAELFIEDEEIIFYRSMAELVEKVRYYQRYPEKAKEIGARGRERVLRDHTWVQRFAGLFDRIAGKNQT